MVKTKVFICDKPEIQHSAQNMEHKKHVLCYVAFYTAFLHGCGMRYISMLPHGNVKQNRSASTKRTQHNIQYTVCYSALVREFLRVCIVRSIYLYIE